VSGWFVDCRQQANLFDAYGAVGSLPEPRKSNEPSQGKQQGVPQRTSLIEVGMVGFRQAWRYFFCGINFPHRSAPRSAMRPPQVNADSANAGALGAK